MTMFTRECDVIVDEGKVAVEYAIEGVIRWWEYCKGVPMYRFPYKENILKVREVVEPNDLFRDGWDNETFGELVDLTRNSDRVFRFMIEKGYLNCKRVLLLNDVYDNSLNIMPSYDGKGWRQVLDHDVQRYGGIVMTCMNKFVSDYRVDGVRTEVHSCKYPARVMNYNDVSQHIFAMYIIDHNIDLVIGCGNYNRVANDSKYFDLIVERVKGEYRGARFLQFDVN